MNVTIIGTGHMAKGIGTRVLAGGNGLILVGRDREKAEELAALLGRGAPRGAEANALDRGGTLPGEMVVLAVPYSAVEDVLRTWGSQLPGKILVDITNPLNASSDGFVVPPGSSGAEEIAKRLPPGVKLVKAFNTAFSSTLETGSVAGVPLDIFIAGDDDEAKNAVASVVRRGGLNPVDTGPLARARELESLALLEVRLQFSLNTGFRTGWKLILPA